MEKFGGSGGKVSDKIKSQKEIKIVNP